MIQIDKLIDYPLLTTPWKHKVIDDLFTEESFGIINSAAQQLSFLCQPDKTIPVHIDEAIGYGISKKAENLILDSADAILKNLKKIIADNCGNGKIGGGYFIMPKFGITGRDFQYPIHDESSHKILNLVTYLQPLNSVGTRLYNDCHGLSGIKEIKWRPNRALLFYPQKGITWHNWRGQNSEIPRITLNFFIERSEGLRDTLYKPGESLDNALWFYDTMSRGRLIIEI